MSTLIKFLSSICYPACQRLALRIYHDSDKDFCQLLLLQAEDDPNFQEWFQKETNQFISAAIQNEILKSMAMHIRRPLAKNIKESSYYSIMTDEEQFVICTD